jgi:leader peptidase (prepilin peptidase)/N-methyltransferase
VEQPDGQAVREVMTRAGIGALTYFMFLLIPHLVYPKGMGFGDVKLALLMGLYLGLLGGDGVEAVYLVLVGLIVGCLLGVVLGILVQVLRRERGAFPFGPALALSTVLVVLNFDRIL